MRRPKGHNALVSPMDAALALLARRSRTQRELFQALTRKGYELSAINQTIERLFELGYIDDQRFARSWSRYRVENSKIGSKLLMADLMSRGIDKELAAEVVNESLTPELEKQRALELALRKRKSLAKEEPFKAYYKLARYLDSKGFSSDVIRSVLDFLPETGVELCEDLSKDEFA